MTSLQKYVTIFEIIFSFSGTLLGRSLGATLLSKHNLLDIHRPEKY